MKVLLSSLFALLLTCVASAQSSLTLTGSGVGYVAPVYETESLAIFAAFTTPPTVQRKGDINSFVLVLKNNSIWSRIDLLYEEAAADSQAARINWKSPGTFTLALVDAPVFAADHGYTGDGINDALDTVWDPVNNAGNFLRDDSLIGVCSNTSGQSAIIDAGASNVLMQLRNASDQYIVRTNSGASTAKTNADGSGRFISQRTGANAEQAFRNGVSLGTTAVSSTALAATDFRFLGRATTNSFGIRQQSCGLLGGSLTLPQIAAEDAGQAAYNAALGF